MIRSVCQNMDLLNNYRDKAAAVVPETTNTCFHIANSLLLFLIAVIRFIREDVEYVSTGKKHNLLIPEFHPNLSKDSNIWKRLEQQVSTFNFGIDEAVSRLEKISRLSGLDNLHQLQSALSMPESLPRQNPDEQASLPCFIYPISKTLRFFDCTEDAIQIDRYFNKGGQDTGQQFQSLTLYGVGGVGKSSVALRYAETKIHNKELDAMFWIFGEKEVTIRQSFTDIAVQLKLPGAQPKDHDQNRTLVLDWLQNTSKAT